MNDSIFTKIIKGEIPCYKIYEDTKVIAFLDIYPIQPGHVLVIPKVQIEDFEDLPQDYYEALFNVVKLLAKHIKTQLGVKKAAVRIEGFDVPHAHVHIIPCNHVHQTYKLDRMTIEPDHQALARMSQKLAVKGA